MSGKLAVMLSPRLQAVMDFVPVGSSVADIGTDHALLPIGLVMGGIARRVIAVEKGKSPAAIARRAVQLHGLAAYVQVREGDGLEPLNAGEAEVIILAGIGGENIAGILSRSSVAQAVDMIIVQPMNRSGFLRGWLTNNEWLIRDEDLVLDREYLYQVIVAVPGASRTLSFLEQEIGPIIYAHKHPLLGQLVKKLVARYEAKLCGLQRSERDKCKKDGREIAAKLELLRECQW